MTLYRNIAGSPVAATRWHNIANVAISAYELIKGQVGVGSASGTGTVSFAGHAASTGGTGFMSTGAGALALAGAATASIHAPVTGVAGIVALTGAGMGNVHTTPTGAGTVALTGAAVAGVKITKTAAGTVSFSGIVSATVSGYKAAVLTDSPLGYWRLLESSGTTAADSSGNGHTGTYTGTFTLGATSPITNDATAKALNLTACTTTTNGYVSIPDAIALNPTGMALTVECWLKFKTSGVGTNPFAGYVFKNNSGSTAQWGLGSGNSPDNNHLATMHAYTSADSSGGSAYSPTADDGSWHHIVGVYNGSSLTIYKDGTAAGSSSYTQTGNILSASGEPLLIGNIFGALVCQWDGYICEVAVYGTALSSTRILAHYNAA